MQIYVNERNRNVLPYQRFKWKLILGAELIQPFTISPLPLAVVESNNWAKEEKMDMESALPETAGED